jgi:NAD(P)H-dependent nitrite reductase small subunit
MAYLDTALKAEELAVGESRLVTLGEVKVALFHTTNGLFAINDVCPHRGAPLHEGFVTDGYVTCPWHQWNFQLSDGVCRNIPGARVASYRAEVRDGTVWIDLG